jgi:hypothetical protein
MFAKTLKINIMKKLIILIVALSALSVQAQSLKTLTDKAEKATESVEQSSFIDKFAGDQVKKLAKKLNLSESQQTQVSSLVVSQLKSEKFQKLIGSFSPEQLLSGGAKKEVSKALTNDSDFKSGMDDILTDEQKKKVSSSKMKS